MSDQPSSPPPIKPDEQRPEQLADLLVDNFERIADTAVTDPIPVFAGRERWQVWQRR